MANAIKYIQKGENIDYIAEVAVEYQQIIPFATRIGVAQAAAEAGETVAVTLTGVYDMKADNSVLSVGDEVFFDKVKGVITSTSGGDTVPAGMAVAAKSAGDDTARIRIG